MQFPLKSLFRLVPPALFSAWLSVLTGKLLIGSAVPFYELDYAKEIGGKDLLIILVLTAALTVLFRFLRAGRFVLCSLVSVILSVYLAVLLSLHPGAPFRIGVLLVAFCAFTWLYSSAPRSPALILIILLSVYAVTPFITGRLNVKQLEAAVQPPSSLLILPFMLLLSLFFLFILWFCSGRGGLFDFARQPVVAKGKSQNTAERITRIAALLALILHVVFLSALMVMRVRSLYVPTYDFGIFSQMFYNMRETLLPVTTLERSYELSHFAIHVSPIYYLWLPFYVFLPRPETIQVLQIVTVASGVIPFFLIIRRLGLPKEIGHLLTVVYLFYPALIGSSMYDVHENAFLAPLILWMLWAAAGRRNVLFYVFSFLVLAVKEDASLYVIAVGIWFFFDRSRRLHGVAVTVVSVVWFLLAARFLDSQGHGVMTYRFANLMAFSDLGLPGILLTVIANPGFLLSEMMSAEKIQYLIKMLLPAAFLPLWQKRLSRYALLIPLVVMNLSSRYQYQANIGFQYHYGSGVLLLFLALLWFADRINPGHTFASVGADYLLTDPAVPDDLKRTEKNAKKDDVAFRRTYLSVSYALILSLLASVVFGTSLFLHYTWPFAYVRENKEDLAAMHRLLEDIPEDAPVRASTFLTTPLSNRPFLIDLGYENLPGADRRQADYLVFDLRSRQKKEIRERMEQARQSGDYVVFGELKDLLLVLRHKDAD
jgi:uncharacterized membrane protein